MDSSLLKVAQGLLLHGHPGTGQRLARSKLFDELEGIPASTFRTAGDLIGTKRSHPGLKFFDSTVSGKIAFGAGAGLAIGVSVGAEHVRALLIDANGWEYCRHQSEPLPAQKKAEPRVVLARIRSTVADVLTEASTNTSLTINDSIPVVGCGVAWPTAVGRDGRPSGYSLTDANWSRRTLAQSVQASLGVRDMPIYTLNDAHAVALAVAHYETHRDHKEDWNFAHLSVVLRLAENISGAIIVIEPNRSASGFLTSILLAGVDNHAGDIGHAPIPPELVTDLNEDLPKDLAPLVPQRCSCTPNDEVHHHLEAYASVPALTHRLYPDKPQNEALRKILSNPEDSRHFRALRDIGALAGATLLAPVALLNPHMIQMSGVLAVPSVTNALIERIDNHHQFGRPPTVNTLDSEIDSFIRAKGAALALLRNYVHRNLDKLLVSDRYETKKKVESLTINLTPESLKKP